MSSFILETVRANALQNWIAVNAAGSLKTYPRDSWRAYLQANSGVGSTWSDLENSFLNAALATGATLHDKWNSYLIAQGAAGSKCQERARNRYK